ncbi:MAG: GTPase HflX [Gammaproteobacteria bacterium]|nr:GTPase HflX [Gammaproteobacteria bacterium]
MFERPDGGDEAVLVHIDFSKQHNVEDYTEFKTLVISAGVHPVSIIGGSRDVPDSKYFIGTGKAEEVRGVVKANKVSLVIFNHTLTPAQTRNLEKLLECRVIDRTGLILDIFAQRAKTFEGKLQVELAQLNYMATRLVRGWTHLERQKGGIGLRGPGETQLETDRRLLRKRIDYILQRLEKVRLQREQNRRARQKVAIPTVSFVGYTNAGKSTLFNRLLHENLYAADKLFATLDPTLRGMNLPDVGKVIFADTVGFIRHLPHDLVEAFKATLEETAMSDLLLLIIDLSDPEYQAKLEQVKLVLEEIEADQLPIIEVYNKIDNITGIEPKIERDDNGNISKVWLSALTESGLDLLRTAVVERLSKGVVQLKLKIPFMRGDLRSRLFSLGAVKNEEMLENEQIWILSVRAPILEIQRIFAHEGTDWQDFILH